MLRPLVVVTVWCSALLPAPAIAQGMSEVRIGIGLALIGGGVGMLAFDPQQPVQPDLVSPAALAGRVREGVWSFGRSCARSAIPPPGSSVGPASDP